jgi:DNA-binding transcriptional LysR family regulator
MRTLDDLRGLVVFAEVVESRSFVRAAATLGMTRSAVSKHVAQLEAQLGVQLLSRTTRKLSLTEVGERVHAASIGVRESAERAREAAQTHQGVVEGKLRVTAPVGLAREHLVPLAQELLQKHPRLEIALVLSDEYIDLVDQRIDVALRVGAARDSSFVTRKIAQVAMLICASPAYLAQHGIPRKPDQLANHQLIQHMPSADPTRITLSKGRRSVEVHTGGRFSCNDGAIGVQAAIQGLGMIMAPDFEVSQEVRSGRLVPVLKEWTPQRLTLAAVSPPRRHVSSKVRTFVDFVHERWRTPPWALA